MRLVVLRIENRAVVVQRPAQAAIGVELLLDPERAGLEERREAARGGLQVDLEDPLELEERLVVEADVRQILGFDSGLAEAVRDRARREGGVTLDAGEPLLLRRGHDLAVAEQAGRAVVVERGDAEDVDRARHGAICWLRGRTAGWVSLAERSRERKPRSRMCAANARAASAWPSGLGCGS